MCVSVYVFEKVIERERKKETERERVKERKGTGKRGR